MINQIKEIESPSLVFYRYRIVHNIKLLSQSINKLSRLRPHVKTHKTREITTLLLEAGITKFKCATIAEAEMLAMCKAPDVLMAYQPVGPHIGRFVQLIQRYPDTKFSCLVDDFANAELLAAAAQSLKIEIDSYLDMNVGMNRTGIFPDNEALKLYEDLTALNGIHPVGLHAYDGHINDASLEVRNKKAAEVYQQLLILQKNIRDKGFQKPILIAGGTPTFPFYAAREDIICSPGTFILWDYGYQEKYTEQAYLTAALVVCRVISLPEAGTICVDLGHKAVAAENDLSRRVYFLNAPGLIPLSQSEEHLTLKADKNHNFKIGDVLYGIPVHICPTCALYTQATIVEQNQVIGNWEIIARNRKINI
jgi:D-serine deaminase-like pyridoxal phosphate-dependent protein